MLCSSISRKRRLGCRTMYPIFQGELQGGRPFPRKDGADRSGTFRRGERERAGGTPLIFNRRIVTSFPLFSPYCRALTFNGSFPGVETIARRLLARRAWVARRGESRTRLGWSWCAHDERTRARKSRSKIRRLSVRNRVINREGGGERTKETRAE